MNCACWVRSKAADELATGWSGDLREGEPLSGAILVAAEVGDWEERVVKGMSAF